MTPMPSPRGSNREGLFLPARSAGAAYDAQPDRGETMDQFLRRVGVSQDVIDAFHHMVEAANTGDDPREQHAEDDEEESEEGSSLNNTKLGDQFSRLDAFLRDKLQGDDVETCRGLVDHLLRLHNVGATEDALPSRGRNGMPKNNIDAGRAMDARLPSTAHIHTGSDGSYDPFLTSRRSTGRAMTMRERDDFAKRFPEAARIKCGDF
jgi:uncharacterized protein YcbK (DUF882 family)